ncbi:MAG: 2-hydroxyglutaryl-CoA dehydratase [Eubacteriales bacterium]
MARNYVEFTKQMKKEYTILAPDMLPIHLSLLSGIFAQYGYRLHILKYTGKKVLDTGLKYVHNDMCYPAICTLGQLLYAITCGDYDPHCVALMHFQTGGGCRASNYLKLLRKSLHNMGMDYVPVISVNFKGFERHSGFKITPMMVLKGMVSLLYGDMLMLLKNQVQPYEIHKGDAQRVVDYWIDELNRQFEHNRGLRGRRLEQNLDRIAADFSKIEVVRDRKVKVGIVGEIYVKYASLGNNGLESFLESEGCEYMVPGVISFFQYSFSNPETDRELYGGGLLRALFSRVCQKALWGMENKMLDTLRKYPQFIAPSPFGGLCKKAEILVGRGVKMGEGWLLPAEMAELIELGYSNIICAQPFGCLPNHIVGKGVVRHIRELYPDANICQVDYDTGASQVNQENRIKLMLAVARENLERRGSGERVCASQPEEMSRVVSV